MEKREEMLKKLRRADMLEKLRATDAGEKPSVEAPKDAPIPITEPPRGLGTPEGEQALLSSIDPYRIGETLGAGLGTAVEKGTELFGGEGVYPGKQGTIDTYKQIFSKMEESRKAKEAKSPGIAQAGQLGSEILATGGLGLVPSAAVSAVEGATREPGDLLDKVKAGGLAGGATLVGGKLMQKGAPLVAKGFEKMAGAAKEGAESLSGKAMGLTAGMREKIGEKAAQKVGREGLEREIVKPFRGAKGMAEEVNKIKSQAGKEFEDVAKTLKETGINVNSDDMAKSIENRIVEIYDDPDLLSSITKSVDDIAERGATAEGIMKLKEKFAKKGWMETGAPTTTERGRMYRDMWRELQDQYYEAVDLTAKATNNPELLNKLQKAKTDWKFSKDALRGIDKKLAKERGNKMFGLTDYMLGTGAIGYGAGTGDWETSAALLAGKKGLEKMGPQTGAKGMDAARKLLEKVPAGVTSPLTQTAVERGLGKITPEQIQELLNRRKGNE